MGEKTEIEEEEEKVSDSEKQKKKQLTCSHFLPSASTAEFILNIFFFFFQNALYILSMTNLS